MKKTTISPELLQRHSARGPRYTSYPTALQFQDDFKKQSYPKILNGVAESDDAFSLYVHIPFCRKLCLYCACNVVISQNQSAGDRYLDDLAKEVSLITSAFGVKKPKIEQLHFGGGTPTFLTVPQLQRLYGILEDSFEFRPDGERAIEIDPRVTSIEQLKVLRELGFNRVSFGVQDFDENVQALVNRNQSPEQTIQTFDQARSLGFGRINIDLMYGLPGQNLKTFEKTLSSVIELQPDRIACFGYAHVPWLKSAQNVLDSKALPDTQLRFHLFANAIERLTAADYQFMGLDHFARRDDELAIAQNNGSLRRNFQGYTTYQSKSIIALGVSAISDLAADDGYYVQNYKDLAEYRSSLNRGELPVERGIQLSPDDALRREIIMTLMCGDLNWEKLAVKYPQSGPGLFEAERQRLENYEELGFVNWTDAGIHVTELGRFFIRNICMVFDSYLKDKNPAYSSTI